MRAALSAGFVCLLLATQPASGQRLLEEWRVRTSAGPEALNRGPTAVFWNPAQVIIEQGRGEVAVIDLYAPRSTGIDGLAAAGALVMRDGRTTFGLGYEHVGVSDIEETTTTPDSEGLIDLAEDRFAIAVSHLLNERMRVGALVQYTLLPEIVLEKSVIALGAGFRYQPAAQLPLHVAAMAATEGDDAYWMAGVELASPWRIPNWAVRAEYGAAGGQLAPGITHRLAAVGEWRQMAEASVGVAVEPDGDARSVMPLGSLAVRLNRYRLGVVREQLPNGFGGAYSFRFSVSF